VPAEVARQAQARPSDTAPRKDAQKPGAPPAREVRDLARSEGATKPKRSRKRPALAAVPNADEGARESAVAAPPKASSGRGSPAPVRPVVSPAASPRPVVGPTRKKRELPPYLRVVK
jgi:hypothetical protein